MHNTTIPKVIFSAYIQAIITLMHFLKHTTKPIQSFMNLGKRCNFYNDILIFFLIL